MREDAAMGLDWDRKEEIARVGCRRCCYVERRPKAEMIDGSFRQHAKFINHTTYNHRGSKPRDTSTKDKLTTMTPISTPMINIMHNLLFASCPSKLCQRIWHWWQRATNSSRRRGRWGSSIPHRWCSRYTQVQVVHVRSILLVKRTRRCRLLCPCRCCIASGIWR